MATTLTRYQPRTGVTRLPDLMDRLFQESFVAPSIFNGFFSDMARPTLPANLAETGDGYIVQVALPGINLDQLEVTVMGREVSIKGRFEASLSENARWIWQGIPTGEFFETYTLPTDVEKDQVHADYQNGILYLTLPKVEHAKPKSIKVSVTK